MPFHRSERDGTDLKALWVDDDYQLTRELTHYFSDEGYALDCVEDLAGAARQLQHTKYDLVLVDLDLPDGSGLSLIRDMPRSHAQEVVIITGHGSVSTVVQALRHQVFDYLTKPLDLAALDNLLERVKRARDVPGARTRTSQMPRSASIYAAAGNPDGDLLIGDSAAIKGVFALLSRAASSDITVLLQGETGTGKEVAARCLHRLSSRANGPFIAYNCAAISPLLIASELFGHEKGSFTGALQVHKGIFERAEGGTLLLDEITEMPLDLQVSLLRVLETGTVRRVGAEREVRLNVRVVAATNRDPMQYVRDGKFRPDLYYRLQVYPVTMPSLRLRPQDIPVLARHFLRLFAAQGDAARELSPAASRWLQQHHWPGNVRELRNVMERACLLSGEIIEVEHLFPSCCGAVTVPLAGEIQFSAAAASKAGSLLHDKKHDTIVQTLADCGGNKGRAAARLGISLKTLYNKLK